ncbi:MAG: EI24 domain-containing protein [Bradymonadaceae bacterium]|nr:EI24 domain-containing protein [Lujinxingiaceae bacterium]
MSELTPPDHSDHPLLVRMVGLQEAGKRARFFAGLSLPLQATKFLVGRPKMWVWAIIPALINLALFVIVAALFVFNVGRVLGAMWSRPEIVAWYDYLLVGGWYLVFALLAAVGVVLSYFVVLIVGGVVASPFNDLLSQRTELALTGRVGNATEGMSQAVSIARSVGASLLSLVLYLALIVPLFALNLIPGIGSVVYTVLATAVSIYFLAVEYSDNVLDRHGFHYADKLRAIRAHIDFAGGFGAGTSLLLFVPVLNLLAMPIAVVAGTIAGLAIKEWPANPSSAPAEPTQA